VAFFFVHINMNFVVFSLKFHKYEQLNKSSWMSRALIISNILFVQPMDTNVIK